MAYVGKTLETPDFTTVDVLRVYIVECSDCSSVYTLKDGSDIDSRADALAAQREHYAGHYAEYLAREA